jgi:hypothetical protein
VVRIPCVEPDLPEENVPSSAVSGNALIAFSLLTEDQISALVSFLHEKAWKLRVKTV